MTWGVGANDLANVMSTSMGSKSITVRQAILIAIVFELAGAFLGGGEVTETMRDGIINISVLGDKPLILVEGMLAILIAGTIWMNLASFLGLPVSITNAIVGSVVGFGCVELGMKAIHWQQVSYIAISWVTSPLIAGICGFILISTIQRLIFGRRNPIEMAEKLLPIYLFLVGLVLSFITVFKGLHHFGVNLSAFHAVLVVLGSGLFIAYLGAVWIKKLPTPVLKKRRDRFNFIESQFSVLMALTTCAMVFAHGSNDISIAVGPLSVIHTILKSKSSMALDTTGFPAWIVLLGCFGVISGLIFYGRKVIETVGSSITALTPSRAFAATIAAATTVVISTSTGIPVSATQTLVGAVLGVGLARGIAALNLRVIRNIFMSWIITLPASSLLTILFYNLIKRLIG
jgi:PiT family inorganic phosphate transporter